MKRGLIFGGVAWLLSLVIMPFLAPLLFSGGNMQALGKGWFLISFFVVAIPAFLIGFFTSRKDA